jgi:hypothetical protein
MASMARVGLTAVCAVQCLSLEWKIAVCTAEFLSLERDQCANSLCSRESIARVPVLATLFHAVSLFDLFF